jgi:HK97 family phage major capsid protein
MAEELIEVARSIEGGIKSLSGKVDDRFATLQRQVDAIDARGSDRMVAGVSRISLTDHLSESDQFQRLLHDKRGTARLTLTGPDAMQYKTTITGPIVGYQTTGVLPIERIPGIVPEARQALTIRDVLTARPTSYSVVDYVKVLSPMAIASPQAEGNLKAENAVTFVSSSERIRTLATWVPATRQILDDFQELAGFLESSLRYYTNLAEEQQMLAGDGSGEFLHGIIPQASAFNSGLLVPASGWNRIDIIGRAIEQLTVAKEIPPTFCVLHPQDWWSIRLSKDSLGRYLIGDPQTTANARLFDLDVVSTVSIAPGSFLVGSGQPEAVEVRDRMELQYEISTEHSDYFARNMVACRAEKRLAIVVKRPASFVAGTFTTSPAS